MKTGSGRKILIIEDETDVADLLTLNLRNGGYNVLTAADGPAGLRKARDDSPDFIILDLLLPKLPGLEVCRILKSDPATAQIPILILTAKAKEIDRVVGLEFGADDYVTKPFSVREVVLRIRAILRRGNGADERLNAGPFSIDTGRHEVRVNGKQVHLTSIEFKLLQALMERRGRVAQRDRLLKEVWGYDHAVDPRTVDAHVRRLRKKLGKARDAVQTVRDFGYRLEGSETECPPNWIQARSFPSRIVAKNKFRP
jgi:two-component system phosphate regulon response regulator PhoB